MRTPDRLQPYQRDLFDRFVARDRDALKARRIVVWRPRRDPFARALVALAHVWARR